LLRTPRAQASDREAQLLGRFALVVVFGENALAPLLSATLGFLG
jgi:hypothetical protein